MKTSHREIAIFWDYENVPLPSWCSPAEAAKCIHNAVAQYGRIVERRLYFDYAKHINPHLGPRDCSSLDLSGFDLVNSPTRNSKETLDKKLIADVLTFAWDCSVRNIDRRPCVVLLTSDGDYAYTLAKLRDRGVMNIVMFGAECSVAQILLDNADVALSFEKRVLSSPADSHVTPSRNVTQNDPICNLFFKNLPRSTSINDFVQYLERTFLRAPVQHAKVEHDDNPTADWCYAHVEFTTAQDGARVMSLARQNSMKYGGRVVQSCIDTRIPAWSKGDSSYMYSKTEPMTVSSGMTLRSPLRVPVSSSGGFSTGEKGPEAYVFLKNLPRSTNITSFVKAIEKNYRAQAARAKLEIPGSRAFCYAHVEFASTRDGEKIIRAAQEGALIYKNNKIMASIDRNFPSASLFAQGNSATCFVRRNARNTSATSTTTDDSKFCLILQNEQKSIATFLTISFDHCWVPAATVAQGFQSSSRCKDISRDECKELHRAVRDGAISRGFVEVSRRRTVGDRAFVSVSWLNNNAKDDNLSQEIYIRLTKHGLKLVQDAISMSEKSNGIKTSNGPSKSPNQNESFIFLKNIPTSTNICDLVEFFETQMKAPVKFASIEPARTILDWCFAHIEFFHAADGKRILGTQSSELTYKGRTLQALIDTRIPPRAVALREPKLCYMYSRIEDSCSTSDGTISLTSEPKNDKTDSSRALSLSSEARTDQTDSLTDIDELALSSKKIPAVHASSTTDFDAKNMSENVSPNSGISISDMLLVKNEQVQNSCAVTLSDFARVDIKIPEQERELEAAIFAKDFKKAASIQQTIDELEKLRDNPPKVDKSESKLDMIRKDLEDAINEKDFIRAASIQDRIKALEAYIGTN